MSYFLTHSGVKIDLANFNADMVCLEDISHHLTKICRYGGALPLNKHYSVAQHSLILASCAQGLGFEGKQLKACLLHDASEAYLGDLPSHVKRFLPDYKALEKKVSDVIYTKYGIVPDKIDYVGIDILDKRVVLDEAIKLFDKKYYSDFLSQCEYDTPLDLNIKLCGKAHIKNLFLTYCNRLGIKD